MQGLSQSSNSKFQNSNLKFQDEILTLKKLIQISNKIFELETRERERFFSEKKLSKFIFFIEQIKNLRYFKKNRAVVRMIGIIPYISRFDTGG